MDTHTNEEIAKLKAEVAKLEGRLHQMAHAINLKVNKQDVINQINISPENIRISGNKITVNEDSMIANNIFKKEGN